MKILIIEDNPVLRENLVFLLKKSGFVTESAKNGQEALEKISKTFYDAMVLDINMPVMNGKELLQNLKNREKNIPTIVLTANSLLEDKLALFQLWVLDYMTKPFEIPELVARIQVLWKREKSVQDDTIKIWNFEINYTKKQVSNNGKNVEFPYKQYLILEYLAKNRGYPKSKLKIMEYVWGETEENLEFHSTTLESHIYAIRKKLGKESIKTLKWIWYIIE